MSTNYHTPIPAAPAQPEATSDLFNSRFSDLDTGITGKLDPAGDGSNLKNTFSQAAERTNVVSGEKISTSLGKIRKWFSDLAAAAFTGSYNDLVDKPTTMDPTVHAASHKTGGSDALSASDIGAVPGIAAGTNVTTSVDPVTGIVTVNAASGGSGGSAHIISDQGAALPQQGTLDFSGGLAASDDSAAFKTVAKMADMPAQTIKGNNLATSGPAANLTVAEARTLLLPATMAPTTHAASHEAGGSDALTLTKGQISDFPAFEISTTNIKPDGTASVGVLNTIARADHVHPFDDSGWITATLNTGWSGTVDYRKIGKFIDVVIQLTCTEPADRWDVAFTLPEGYRPSKNFSVLAAKLPDADPARFTIYTNGTFQYATVATASTSTQFF